jgi:hypothetical protein
MYTNHNNNSMTDRQEVVTTVHNSVTDKGEVVYMVDNNSGVNLRENSILMV